MKRQCRWACLAAIAFTSMAAFCSDYVVSIESPDSQTNLIELFTSEGCYSCPPAEQWVNSLLEQPGLWQQFVPVVFHVDYWDRLGWKDKYASPEYSERQYRYRVDGGITSVYTPGILVNGREYRKWFSRRVLPGPSSRNPGKLSVRVDANGSTIVRFKPLGKGPDRYQANLAILGFDFSTEVEHGENAGKTLNHEFVVLDLISGLAKPAADNEFRFETTIDLPANKNSRYAVAGWVSEPGRLASLQSTGGWVSP